jgi:hypothetical protein
VLRCKRPGDGRRVFADAFNPLQRGMKMPSLKFPMLSAALVLGIISSMAQAQVMIDMSKYTCEQLLRGNANSTDAAVWLSGYYNGTRKNTMLDLNQFKQNAEAVVKECNANPKDTVMKTVDKLLARKK